MKKTVCMITVSGMLIILSAGCNKDDKAEKPAQTAVEKHNHGGSCDHGHETKAANTNKWEPETAAPLHKHSEHDEHDGHDHSGHKH